VGCVLPRPLVSGAGSESLRREYFTHWTIASVDMVWNQRRWVFPGINDRVQSVLLAARKKQPTSGSVIIPSAAPLNDPERFARAREIRVDYALSTLEAWSPTLELPALPSPEAAQVFALMFGNPRFDDEARGWRALPYRELDSSADRDLYNEQGVGWPVWKGNTFDQYRPDIAPPVYWADPEPVLERLQQKRRRSRAVFDHFAEDVLADPKTLPPLDCRILFRDVVRATDRRTMKACLAPPNIFAMEKSPQLVWPRGSERDVLFVLAVFNSLPFDWIVRRRVENKMAFGILNSLPVPEASVQRERLAELAGRLSCVDDRYSDFAQRAGVDVRSLSDEERLEMQAEIDALIAHAYGLKREHLEVIFADFVEAAVSASYRVRVLRRYEIAGG
jgi:hypothetical protein